MRTSPVAILLLALVAPSSCVDAPQEAISLQLDASGSEVEDLEMEEDFTLTLTRADLAFGPLYLCPGPQAGELCDTARVEWVASAVVDALSTDSQELGALTGVTGPVRSWMFDYGISSLLTQERPVSLEAAKELGDASLIIEGTATISTTEIPFEARVIVAQGEDTERGVPVVRKSTTDAFDFEITPQSERFSIHFDPANWLGGLRRAHFEGSLSECVIGMDESCPSLSFEADSDVARALGQAMTSGERPTFSLD